MPADCFLRWRHDHGGQYSGPNKCKHWRHRQDIVLWLVHSLSGATAGREAELLQDSSLCTIKVIYERSNGAKVASRTSSELSLALQAIRASWVAQKTREINVSRNHGSIFVYTDGAVEGSIYTRGGMMCVPVSTLRQNHRTSRHIIKSAATSATPTKTRSLKQIS